MSMNYQDALTAQAAAADKAKRDELNARGWTAILNNFTLRDSQANYQMLVDWVSPHPLTLESFAELIRTKPEGLTLDAVSREWLIDDIIAHSHGDTNTLRQLKFKLSTYSLGQLREKRRSIDFKQEVRTPEAAKLYLKENRQDTSWRGTGYPTLPPQIVPQGQVKTVPTGEFMRSIAKTELWLFKRYVKLYGSEQVNYWLAN